MSSHISPPNDRETIPYPKTLMCFICDIPIPVIESTAYCAKCGIKYQLIYHPETDEFTVRIID